MRKLISALLLIFVFSGLALAQEEDNCSNPYTAMDPYENALRMIEEARVSGATELSFYSWDLEELPPEIGQLTELKSLVINNNRLTSLPPEIGQLTNLESLNLDCNQLTSLPPEIGQLTRLKRLELDSNYLTSLPPEIGQLTNLQHLILNENYLTSLPPEIGQLRNLCSLALQANQLRELPNEIGQLRYLEDIDRDFCPTGSYFTIADNPSSRRRPK